jgi:hypothetical protein
MPAGVPFPYKLPSGRTIVFADEPLRDPFTPEEIAHFERITFVLLTAEEREHELHRQAEGCRVRTRAQPTAGQQCCERDHDRDGNCDRHPASSTEGSKSPVAEPTSPVLQFRSRSRHGSIFD